MLPLRAAINKAKLENKTVRKENVRVEQNGTSRMVNLEVVPLKNVKERSFLIWFEGSQGALHAIDALHLDDSEPLGPKRPVAGTRGGCARSDTRRSSRAYWTA